MIYRLKGAAPPIVVWDLDEADGSGADENSSRSDEDDDHQHGLHSPSSNSLEEEAITPEVMRILLRDDDDSIRFRRSALAEAARTTLAEGSWSAGMRGGGSRGPLANTPTHQELESLDVDDILWCEAQDDHSSVMTQDSMDLEEFEIDLNDEPGPRYRSVQDSSFINFYDRPHCP
jgi:hypothetical protein